VLLALQRAPIQEPLPFQTYEQQMTDVFDLDEERVRNLRYILRDYHEKIEDLKERDIAHLNPELVKLGAEHRNLIRTWVVPERYRQEFDLWVEGQPAVATRTRPQ